MTGTLVLKRLKIGDYTFIKVVPATHLVCGTIYLDFILGKGDQLFKFNSKFRNLVVEDLPQEFLIENSTINVEFLENKAREIVNSIQQIGIGGLLIVNNYNFDLT